MSPRGIDGFLLRYPNGSLLVIVLVLIAVVVGMEQFVPSGLSESTKQIIFQSLISVDGVLIGFIGLVLSMFLTRPRQDIKIVQIFPTFVLSFCLLVASIVSGFVGLVESGESVSRFPALAAGLLTMLIGTAFFFLVVLLTVLAKIENV